jgi:RHS repeat-associated protein
MHQMFAKLPDYDNDGGSDLYNTLNRHYTPAGRWLSPDPGGLKVVSLDDPQTWNMYAYARNNPTTLTDPTGLVVQGQNDPKGHAPYEPSPKSVAMESSQEEERQKEQQALTSLDVAQGQQSAGAVLDPVTDVAPPAPAPSPAPPPTIQPLPLGPLIFAGSLVVGAAEQLINRTTDAFVANQNDQIKYDATMSVVTVENAHKNKARPSTTQDHEEGEARKQRDRGGEAGDARRNKGGKSIVPRVRPDKYKGPWPPPGSSTY